MTESKGHVAGAHNAHQVKFYGISTCIWCRKTRQFLEEKQVSFDFFYVDLLDAEERDAIKDEVRKWNPKVSFPTLVIDEETEIVGYKTDRIIEVLGL